MGIYRCLYLGDANVGRFWQTVQGSRTQLQSAQYRAVSCLDSLETALSTVTDELDYVVVSSLTAMILEEGNSLDIRGSVSNIVDGARRRLTAAAARSLRCEVRRI